MFNSFFNLSSFIFFLCGFTLSTSASGTIASSTAVPLKPGAWIVLSYSKIPANSVSFSDGLLSVKVASSAGPIVHKLDRVQRVLGFSVKGKLSGSKRVETGAFDEDSVLRFGLVATGTQTLTGLKKLIAADWVKKLFALAPAGSGLDKIYFFNVTNREELFGKSRTHPKSDLMVENVSINLPNEGAIELNKKLDFPIDTAAIWISVDGDDTKSAFTISISDIKLEVAQ